MNCWLCDHPIENPPEVIGHWHAVTYRVAHRQCLTLLGELDLELQQTAGPGSAPRQTPGRP